MVVDVDRGRDGDGDDACQLGRLVLEEAAGVAVADLVVQRCYGGAGEHVGYALGEGHFQRASRFVEAHLRTEGRIATLEMVAAELGGCRARNDTCP